MHIFLAQCHCVLTDASGGGGVLSSQYCGNVHFDVEASHHLSIRCGDANIVFGDKLHRTGIFAEQAFKRNKRCN